MKQMIKKLAIVLSVALVCAPMGAMAANKLIVKGTDGTTDKMVVTDTGRIGIGTNAPDAGLHIKGAVYPDNAIKVEGNAATGGAGFIGYLVKPSVLPLNTERLGFFLFGSMSGATAMHAAGIESRSEGDWTLTSTPANFTFMTTPSGQTTRYERMRIASSGFIGMGTSAPTQRLEVNGGIKLTPTSAKPACTTSAVAGTTWFTVGGVGVADLLEVCAKDAAGAYAWRRLN